MPENESDRFEALSFRALVAVPPVLTRISASNKRHQDALRGIKTH